MSSENGKAAYKDLLVWQKSMEFVNAIIDAIDALSTDRKHYRLIEQLESAATSVPLNIAEGKGRYSQKEFVHFLYIACGSIYETMTMLEIFKMRNWIDPQRFQTLDEKSTEIAKMLNGLISSIKTRPYLLSPMSFDL